MLVQTADFVQAQLVCCTVSDAAEVQWVLEVFPLIWIAVMIISYQHAWSQKLYSGKRNVPNQLLQVCERHFEGCIHLQHSFTQYWYLSITDLILAYLQFTRYLSFDTLASKALTFYFSNFLLKCSRFYKFQKTSLLFLHYFSIVCYYCLVS